MGISIGAKIRVVILFILGLVFTLPGALLIVGGFLQADKTSDDALAMFFMGGLLLLVGQIIWWIMRKVYGRAKMAGGIVQRDDDTMNTAIGIGMAQGYYMSSMADSEDTQDASAAAAVDSDAGGDDGADFDVDIDLD